LVTASGAVQGWPTGTETLVCVLAAPQAETASTEKIREALEEDGAVPWKLVA
jgi:hypothetical protein